MRATWWGWMVWIALAQTVLGTANLARAQDAPTLRGEDEVTELALEPARLSNGPQLDNPYARPPRSQRLVRAGGVVLGLGALGFFLGTGISHAVFHCGEDEWICWGPELGVAVSFMVMAPLLVVGSVVLGRGVSQRARERRLSARVQLAGGRYGLSLMGRF